MKIYKILSLYYKKYAYKLVIGFVLLIILSLLILPVPFITRNIIDKVLPNKDFYKLSLYISIILLISITQNILNYSQSILFYSVNANIMFDLRVSLLNKINIVPLNIIKSYGSGYFISRIDDDTKSLKPLLIDSIALIVKDIFTLIFGIISMLYINIKLAIISILLVCIYSYSIKLFNNKIKTKANIYFEKSAKTTERLVESINMIQLIKTFLAYTLNIERYYKIGKEKLDSNIAVGKISFIASLISNLTIGFLPVIVISYGSYQIINNKFTLGSLLAFNSLIGYITGPTTNLLNANIDIQQGLVALRRLQRIFDLPEERIELSEFNEIKTIKIKNLNFSYDKICILKDINLTINKCEKIAIVGESGSGKSTIFNLLVGMHHLTSGKILINNYEQSHSQLIGNRKIISLVDQESFLFNDSIYSNIKLGNELATDEDIYEAAAIARVDEFVVTLKEGYNTIVGNNGSNLSVGQKQRIAIARALVKKPQVLLLDEITSNIDSINEEIIYTNIFSYCKDISIIIITHRLNILKRCDRLIVLNSGTICEEGSHHNLLQKGGYYNKLYNSFIN